MNGIGGMQTSAIKPTLVCPKCNKPAYNMTNDGNRVTYHHFTKKASVMHVINLADIGSYLAKSYRDQLGEVDVNDGA